MTVKPIIWTYGPQKSGKCNIKIYLGHQGAKAYLKTDLSVLPEDWNAKKGEVKKNHPLFRQYNARIRSEVLRLEQRLLDGESILDIKNRKQLGGSLIAYIEDFITKTEMGLTHIKSSTCGRYRATVKRLKQFCQYSGSSDLSFGEIDLVFYDDFKRFLIESKLSGLPGFGQHIKAIKAMMQLAMDQGLHDNQIFQHRLFKKIKSVNNQIYLTKEEIEQIEKLDLSQSPELARERDRFLVSYYFLMRFGDSVRIKRDHFMDRSGHRYLKYKQEKTGHECTVPVKASAWSILQKRDFDFSDANNVLANRRIKEICALAGINTPIQVNGQHKLKWMLVSTHTARRSAATNLVLDGVNLKTVADLGGWHRLETLQIYLRCSRLDTAIVAKDIAFFH